MSESLLEVSLLAVQELRRHYEDGQIQAIRIIVNPEKLARV